MLFLTALVAVPNAVQAETGVSPTVTPAERREVVIAVGYSSIVAPSGLDVYRITNTFERVKALDGFSVDVTRRWRGIEYGVRFWSMPGVSDGRGASAHSLTRFTTQGRFYPWQFHTVEPWIGAELGLALADDFAIWNKTEKEPAHRAVADVRPGIVAGLEVGARIRVASLLALGARGGLMYLGFEKAGGPVAESAQAAKFFVQPTDYGQKLWLSMALTAELTVPD